MIQLVLIPEMKMKQG